MSKIINDHTVINNERLSEHYFILTLQSSQKLPELFPGNFAELKTPDSEGVFLRRPFSIYDVDYQSNTVSFFIKEIGKGTKSLKSLRSGDKINLYYPLGNQFIINDQLKSTLLIGGGSGMAPFKFLGNHLVQKGCKVSFLLGGRSFEDVMFKEKLTDLGKIFITTDDGSIGEKGMVTDHLVMRTLDSFDQIYCCGPEPMMKKIAEITTHKNIPCQVSLEKMMACGIGACICCVTPTIDGLQKVCVEGPVFDVNQLKW